MKKRLIIFASFFVLSFIYWRTYVFLFYNSGEISALRQLTGLTIHHADYGLIFILIAALLLIFHKINTFSVGLMGFGLGSVFDSFVSGLFKFNSSRIVEISLYNRGFFFTIFVFINILLLTTIFYFLGKRRA